MRVQLSDLAERDLLDIALYIAADSPDRAYSFVDELQQACDALADQSLRFAQLPGFEKQGYRRRPYGRYSIIYLVGDRSIRIVRILPAAMDLKAILSGD